MTPTYDPTTRFSREYRKLTSSQLRDFHSAVDDFVIDLKAGKGFRRGLRVKRVQGYSGVWEMTWAPDGRATWEYGDEVYPGEPHIIWRRIGGHEIFAQP